MTESDTGRRMGNNPITDAASATAPANPSQSTEYPADVSSNADLRVAGDESDTDEAGDAYREHEIEPNDEQEDEDAQAQTVADDAIRGDAQSQVESEHAPSGNAAQIVPDDAQDLVDHMNQMERSGRIDMDAYRGERNDDDEAGSLGAREADDHVVRLSDE